MSKKDDQSLIIKSSGYTKPDELIGDDKLVNDELSQLNQAFATGQNKTNDFHQLPGYKFIIIILSLIIAICLGISIGHIISCFA